MSDAKARDLYADLGLAGQQVSQREIRDAYKKLALKSHPDKNLGGDSGGTVEFIKASPHLLFTILPVLFHVRACDVSHQQDSSTRRSPNAPSSLRFRTLTRSWVTLRSVPSTIRATAASSTMQSNRNTNQDISHHLTSCDQAGSRSKRRCSSEQRHCGVSMQRNKPSS